MCLKEKPIGRLGIGRVRGRSGEGQEIGGEQSLNLFDSLQVGKRG